MSFPLIVRHVAHQQYRDLVDRAARAAATDALIRPAEGWLTTVRRALGMSGAHLAQRLGVTRARVSQAERAERDGAVTLKTMESMAEAMGCRFVYAIVPDTTTGALVEAQARRKARALLDRARLEMAFEDQSLPASDDTEAAERLARDLIDRMPRDFWSER